ncbi:uncharacterized protein LOC143587796 [Bidens hawaiensis]|uniref:uncharacterized protein LOC143587796 n=1 Tax=Bidens hawaiensis TaxID=980011 RepID=UPI004049B885
MKLNPSKCSLEVEEGKFLRVFVTREGFRANPEKIEALAQMHPPRNLKEVQRLQGRLVALNRFLSKIADRTLPFMAVLRRCMKKNQFCWDSEADKAFRKLKSHLRELPLITSPLPGEKLTLYLSCTNQTISSALMVERKEAQIPIYFVSRTLKGPEERYSPIEKLVLSLVHTARKLRRYFQAHEVQVLTDKPLQRILMKTEISGSSDVRTRGISLSREIDRKQRSTSPEPTGDQHFVDPHEPVWNLHTDGASNEDGSGAGLILVSPKGTEFTYVIRLGFPSTNNESDYEALLAGLRVAQEKSVRRVQAHVDSLLVANQVNGEYEAKDHKMIEYLNKTRELLKGFQEARVVHIPRGQNKKADALSKLASVAFDHLAKDVRVETVKQRSISEKIVGSVGTLGCSWMATIFRYLQEGIVPKTSKKLGG